MTSGHYCKYIVLALTQLPAFAIASGNNKQTVELPVTNGDQLMVQHSSKSLI